MEGGSSDDREPYAIKLLPAMLATHPDAWDQVLANFQLVRKLQSPEHLPGASAGARPPWGPYLVMTFIDGHSRWQVPAAERDVHRRGGRCAAEARRRGPRHAHAQKIIHRDVKHDNILQTLAEDGETITGTCVIDFGLAAQVRSTINRFSQQSVTAAGTRPYMAPEIWRSRPRCRIGPVLAGGDCV